MSMDTAEWIAHVDRLRETDGLLRRGEWHGYTEPEGGETPMRGRYYLVRWKAPTIAVSHDDPTEVAAIARAVECGLVAAAPSLEGQWPRDMDPAA